ncbi:MAG: hypothetical protein IH819_12705 [Bacteroidetes bacterium]|nr:hypothetical protein [Bacteroidota bacterium]
MAGTDINGDIDGQFRYVAIVIGTETVVDALFDKIGLRTVEMKKLKKHQRRHVKKNMDCSGRGFLAMCLKVDRQKLIKYFTTHPHSKAKFTGKKEVQRYFDTTLLSLLKKWIDGFCQHHGSRFEQLNFQCDPDMSKTINKII